MEVTDRTETHYLWGILGDNFIFKIKKLIEFNLFAKLKLWLVWTGFVWLSRTLHGLHNGPINC